MPELLEYMMVAGAFDLWAPHSTNTHISSTLHSFLQFLSVIAPLKGSTTTRLPSAADVQSKAIRMFLCLTRGLTVAGTADEGFTWDVNHAFRHLIEVKRWDIVMQLVEQCSCAGCTDGRWSMCCESAMQHHPLLASHRSQQQHKPSHNMPTQQSTEKKEETAESKAGHEEQATESEELQEPQAKHTPVLFASLFAESIARFSGSMKSFLHSKQSRRALATLIMRLPVIRDKMLTGSSTSLLACSAFLSSV